MKDFNELLAKDRTFKVRDAVFEFVDAQPEVLTGFQIDTNGDDNAAWKIMDAQIKLFLSEEDGKRWDELRTRTEEPVTIAQLTGILQWLMEEQTGRPTETPSPSAPGPGKTARSSTAGGR